uniref:Uncharacterized protein n=1 Tax=Nothobranchius kadleci TaxID=1051664 RepID=A0A1A8CBE5_NOTKA
MCVYYSRLFESNPLWTPVWVSQRPGNMQHEEEKEAELQTRVTLVDLQEEEAQLDQEDGGCSRTQRSRECPPCWKREGLRQSLLHQELLQTHTLEEYWDLGRELYSRQPGLVFDAWSGALHLLTCLGYHHGAHVETADMPTLLQRKCCNQEPNHRVRPLPHFSLFFLD